MYYTTTAYDSKMPGACTPQHEGRVGERTSVGDLDHGSRCGRCLVDAVPCEGVEVATDAVYHAAVPAILTEAASDAGAAGAVKGVLVVSGGQQELLAEAVHAGAAICRGWGHTGGSCCNTSVGQSDTCTHTIILFLCCARTQQCTLVAVGFGLLVLKGLDCIC
jgi:hypothetical protein